MEEVEKLPSHPEADGPVWPLRRLAESPQLFERFVYGLVLADRESSRLYMNMRARELLVPADRWQSGTRWTCCDLICGRLGPVLEGGCLGERATETEGALPEVRIDVDGDHSRGAAWVTVSRIDAEGAQLLFHLRPAGRNDRRRQSGLEWSDSASTADPDLFVSVLGRFRVESRAGQLDGKWLQQRPGQLLKYLVCERRRIPPRCRPGEG